jgi:hypothetical protein
MESLSTESYNEEIPMFDENILTQTPLESKEQWRDRITTLFETGFKSLNLWLSSTSRSRDLSHLGTGHNFFMYFEHVRGCKVLVTPHSRTGVDLSVAPSLASSARPMFDVKDLRKVIKFVQRELEPYNN